METMKDVLTEALNHMPRITHKLVEGLDLYHAACSCGWQHQEIMLTALKAENAWKRHAS